MKTTRNSDNQKAPFDLGKDLFGQHGSGDQSASVKYKELFKRYLKFKMK